MNCLAKAADEKTKSQQRNDLDLVAVWEKEITTIRQKLESLQ